MSDRGKLVTDLEYAERDLSMAFAHKRVVMSKLEAAEAWVNDALRREQEARFALRTAPLPSQDRGGK